MTRFGWSADLPRRPAPSASALERHAGEHAASLDPVVEQPVASRRRARATVGQDGDAAPLELRGLRVLVLVDHVLVDALGHELPGLRLHPGGDERGQVEAGVAVEHQLVVDDLVGDVGAKLAVGDAVSRDRLAFEREERRDGQVVLVDVRDLGVLQGHGVHLVLGFLPLLSSAAPSACVRGGAQARRAPFDLPRSRVAPGVCPPTGRRRSRYAW